MINSKAIVVFLFFSLLTGPINANFNRLRTNVCIRALYSLGDSLADTGNLIREGAYGLLAAIVHLPYGVTIFGKPTGRCSDGLLMIDYLAKALKLPLVAPILEKGGDFTYGANFAVAGATALSSSFFKETGINIPFTNSSLHVQLQRFKTHLSSTCSSPSELAKKLEHSLVLVGEIGGNDYNYAFLAGKSVDELTTTFVPLVVQAIVNATREVIELGASRVVVAGNLPIGCIPVYLAAVNSKNQSDFDENNCIKGLNAFAMIHNTMLQEALVKLRRFYPRTLIIYADYYHAFMHMIGSPANYGFEKNSLTKACCGSGGEYNFHINKLCGTPRVSVCKNPANHISWDGIHLTQEAYKVMATNLMRQFHFPRYGFQTFRRC